MRSGDETSLTTPLYPSLVAMVISLQGKKARRERKLLKERQLRTHMSTPPLYARRGSPTYEPYEPEDRELRCVCVCVCVCGGGGGGGGEEETKTK